MNSYERRSVMEFRIGDTVEIIAAQSGEDWCGERGTVAAIRSKKLVGIRFDSVVYAMILMVRVLKATDGGIPQTNFVSYPVLPSASKI